MKQQEVRGKVNQVKGRVKEAVGIVTGNPSLEREGAKQRVVGVAQGNLGKARQKVNDLVDGLKTATRK